MSGVSLAVSPGANPNQNQLPPQQKQAASGGSIMGSLRIIELQLVAFILVFSASGLVPLLDLIFPPFATVYFITLSRFAFTANNVTDGSPAIFQGSRIFRVYIMVGTTVGLFLPLAYVLGGFARGDDHAVRSATPHLFLLSCQILTENVISGMGLFLPPVRALVPLLYTIRRIFTIGDWINDVWLNKTLPVNAPYKDEAWYWFGRVLAIANLVYFSINLFGFLIPRFLPKAFERYFEDKNEIHAKTLEDKRSSSMNNKKEPRVSDKKAY